MYSMLTHFLVADPIKQFFVLFPSALTPSIFKTAGSQRKMGSKILDQESEDSNPGGRVGSTNATFVLCLPSFNIVNKK